MKKELIIPNDTNDLIRIINEKINKEGNLCNLNHIDVSEIKDFGGIFASTDFNGDISKWDVSNALNMRYMFAHSKFNGDISSWNVSNVQDMRHMFMEAKFNQNIDDWNICSVIEFANMFSNNNIAPYWAQYETQEERIIAYNNYWLNKKINNKLPTNLEIKNKHKI